MKNPKELEKIVKGFGNGWRIKMLELLETAGPLPLVEIADRLKMNMKTASVHSARIHNAGLIDKDYEVNSVRHTINSRGRAALAFLRKIE